MASQQQTGRAASRARRELQVNGKGRSAAASTPTRQPNRKERQSVPAASPAPAPQEAAPVAQGFTFTAPVSMPTPKRAQKSPSRLRRESLAARGKVADKSRDRQRSQDMLRTAKKAVEAKKGDCGCGGPCCQEAEAKAAAAVAPVSAFSVPASSGVKVAKKKPAMNANGTGRMLSRARRIAMSGRGKAGLEAHGKGNSSASLARQANPEISSRDLARVVRDSRSKNGACGSSAAAAPARARRPRNAAEAMKISGTKVTHTEKMTGDEAGLCHSGITGTAYMASEVFEKFCQKEAPKAPKKVEQTETLRGGRVTSGGKVGASTQVTGDERGSCREITGSEYLGKEHFKEFCNTEPKGAPAKVSHSQTRRGLVISGPKPARSEKVTGNEPGTCKAVTGTPYAGVEDGSFCAPQRAKDMAVRTARSAAVTREISGIQPGLSGKRLSGVERGACKPISGTPYLGGEELKEVCGAIPAQPGDADFPQVMGSGSETWGEFSVVQPSEANRKTTPISGNAITGTGYESGAKANAVTGTFSMGQGKVTGTEQFRHGERIGRGSQIIVPSKDEAAAPVVDRVTGEGIETSQRITGDDWDRGNRVTGTEGFSAARRNPTRRGGSANGGSASGAMPQFEAKRNAELDRPSANVTGGTGGSTGSAAITVSGGARG